MQQSYLSCRIVDQIMVWFRFTVVYGGFPILRPMYRIERLMCLHRWKKKWPEMYRKLLA